MGHTGKFIFLIGFMASGKTVVGKKLAAMIHALFIDTDELIEKKEGMPITAIFEKRGEDYFREVEFRVLKEIIYTGGELLTIVATGGGMPCFGNNLAVMKAHGSIIYLQSNLSDIIQRIDHDTTRPLFTQNLKDKNSTENLQTLLIRREAYYRKADFIIENSMNAEIEAIVMHIAEYLKDRHLLQE